MELGEIDAQVLDGLVGEGDGADKVQTLSGKWLSIDGRILFKPR